MAENVLETRILLRYGTYSQWMNSDVILRIGEAAICAFPRERTVESLSNSTPENTPPAIGIKIGDGLHYFHELPWVQAIAADVYNWAKSSVKPTYTAQEIQGLQNFVENLVSGDTNVTIAPRVYQIVEGTGDNQHKYYLRYKENNEESEWVVDTSAYIDLGDLTTVVNWLGRTNLEDYPSLISRTAEQIRYFIDQLNATDTARTNQFVTSVSESNGIISVERAQPDFTNITGHATIEQGGTGRTSLTEDAVLVGNGTDPVRLVPIAETIANNNYLVPNYLIKQYVDEATSGVTGAMHFVGEASVAITPNSAIDPRIGGYSIAQAQPGDVILYEAKEFVWTGGSWRLLGDEGSYAVKGSIVNADIHEDANIAQSKISNLTTDLSNKVDKVEGKQLSTYDYTYEDRTKLQGIETGAQVNTIEHIFVNEEERTPTTINGLSKSIDLQISVFDDEHKDKLDAIEAGAEVNEIEHIFLNYTELPINIINNKARSVNIPINEFTIEEKSKLSDIEALAQVNKIERIFYDGVEIQPDENKIISITSNPHTEHENVIERIFFDGHEIFPDEHKIISILSNTHAEHENIIERIIYDGNEILPDENKVITITSDPHIEHINKIEHIYYDGTEVLPNAQKAVYLVSNPHTEHENKIEKIYFNGIEVVPNAAKAVLITQDPHTDHINKIETIFINNTEFRPNSDKEVHITIDQAALNLNVLEGATVPSPWGIREDVEQDQKKLLLERIAVTGDVEDLLQQQNTYITLDCGSSTTVI